MSTVELKTALIQRISEIQDKSFLEAIWTILDSKTESKTLIVPSAIADEIRKSRNEIAKGHFISNEDLEKEVEEWLEEK